ncbi:MAG: putative cytokinetic ring protein SteA [Actinomycetota bacterium]|nr:putative cytokinetic ring protein SteA [Actinomycetota bacterium]
MFFKSRRRSEHRDAGPLEGVARVGRRTKQLTTRLLPGEIAVIDHPDLDRIAAEGLVEKQVKAVINAALFSTGRYPNLGALVLCGAGITLIEHAGPNLFARIRDGDRVRLEEGRIFVGDEVVAKGEVVTLEQAQERLDACKKNIATALESFAENTLEYMINERDYLVEAIRLPEIKTDFRGRHVLVVVRGYGYKEDLASLRGYIHNFRPVLVGVDGGADALLDLKLQPDLIIGDMDSVTTRALTSGAELVLHAFPDGTAPGRERLDALNLKYATFQAPGTSEDVALLLAHEKGAELIVAVGARASMVEFMDKGRKGMASTFLVRLRVGPKLVDAKGVSELHSSGPSRPELFGLVLAALVTMLIVVAISQPMRLVLDAAGDWVKDVWFMIRHAVP